jgi:carlactone synthase/all-trans-10'-apo-beta-carotenal 13,14-cleaving dioxygenase
MTLYKNPGGDPSRRQAIAHIPYLRPYSPTWVHQVAVSHNYAVIVQNPCFYGIDNMVFGENNGEFLVFKWEPSAGSLIHVVPLVHDNRTSEEGGSSLMVTRGIKSFRAPAFLATHWINAFESDSKDTRAGKDVGSTTDSTRGSYLNLDGCMTKDPRLMAHWSLDTVRSGPLGGKQIDVSVMRRLVIDLDAPDGTFLGSTTHNSTESSNSNENVLNDGSFLQKLIPDAAHGYAIELPAINEKFSGRQHQFVYAAAAKRPSNCWNALSKADVVNGTVKMWYEAGAVCWEPLFVPRPGAEEEDDGVVLAVIMQADGKSALLVLDGQSFSEVARAVLPYGLSNGFHGCFVPEE